MPLSNKTELSSLISDIQSVAADRYAAAESSRIAAFLSIYFEEAEHGDLSRSSSVDLFGAAAAHYEFAGMRAAGKHKIRVYNPDFERDGWQSTHSVIEMVTDDMPFLIDSMAMFLARQNLNLHLLVHPVLSVLRDQDGLMQDVRRSTDASYARESFIHVQIDRVSDGDALLRLQEELNRVVAAIRLVVSDEPGMRAVLTEICHAIPGIQGVRADEVQEALAFLNWTAANHFLFMGYCDYDLVSREGKDRLKIVKGSGLGILQDQGGKQYSASFEQLPQQLRELAHVPQLIILN